MHKYTYENYYCNYYKNNKSKINKKVCCPICNVMYSKPNFTHHIQSSIHIFNMYISCISKNLD